VPRCWRVGESEKVRGVHSSDFGTSKEMEDLLSTTDVVSLCETTKKVLRCSQIGG
jgi:hypothetical protein